MSLSRLWATLHEPRAITALMVATYLCVGVGMGVMLTRGWHLPPDFALGCALCCLGAAFGAPMAWRGLWGLEAAAAIVMQAGLVWIVIEDGVRFVSRDVWPSWPFFTATALCLMINQRILRIWGHTWQPGTEPSTPLRRAQAAREVAKVQEDAMRAVVSSEHGA